MSGCAQDVCRDEAAIVVGDQSHQWTSKQIGNTRESFGMD